MNFGLFTRTRPKEQKNSTFVIKSTPQTEKKASHELNETLKVRNLKPIDRMTGKLPFLNALDRILRTHQDTQEFV
jgi:hypothetical protein